MEQAWHTVASDRRAPCIGQAVPRFTNVCRPLSLMGVSSTNETRGSGHPKFAGNAAFQLELRRRVDEFLSHHGRRHRDIPAMYAKSIILLAAFALLYIGLVVYAHAWWQAVPLAI